MSIDAYVQVATDGSGKQIDMDQVSTAAGATLYRQRAVMVGIPAQVLDEMLELQRRQLACMRALLSTLGNAAAATEEDFMQYDS